LALNDVTVKHTIDKDKLDLYKDFYSKTKMSKFGYTTTENYTGKILQEYSISNGWGYEPYVVYIIPFEDARNSIL